MAQAAHASATRTNPPGASSLRVLLVEDNPDDAALSLRLLRKCYPDIHCEIVDTREQFSHQVRSTYYDVILADYALGSWNGVDAFNLMRKAGRDAPFILVTGALDDARAAECVKTGITDYILKDRPERLPLAVSRALQERELLKQHDRAERALEAGEKYFRVLADASFAATLAEKGSHCFYANRPAERITGYSRDELVGMSFWGMVAPESRQSVIGNVTQRADKDRTLRYELPIATKQRNSKWLDVTIGVFQLQENTVGTLITAFDISERKRQEKEILNIDPERFALVELPRLRCYQQQPHGLGNDLSS
jgi:PAS domain S-box-containing protein